MNRVSARSEVTAAERLVDYWRYWYEREVADLSEPMRDSLEKGTSAVIERIACMLDAGVADGSLGLDEESLPLARLLHDLWFGASVRAKIDGEVSPLDDAMVTTRKLLEL